MREVQQNSYLAYTIEGRHRSPRASQNLSLKPSSFRMVDLTF